MGFTIYLPNKITSLVFVPGITFLLWAYPLLVSQPIEPNFYNPTFALLSGFLSSWSLDIITGFILALINAMLLSSLLAKHNLFNEETNASGIIYAVLLSSHPSLLLFHPVLIVNILTLLILNRIFISYRKKEAYLECFESGLCSGFAALIYFPAIVLIPFVWIANSIIRPFNWKEYITQGIGIVTPFYLLVATLYCFTGFDTLNEILHGLLPPLYEYFSIKPAPYPMLIFLALMLVWGIMPIIKELKSRAVRGKKLYTVLGWLGFLGLLSTFLLDPINVYSAPMLAIPLSIYLSNAVKNESRQWLRGTIIFLILCIVVYTHIVTLQ